jgi:hypothetical protein
MRVMKRSFIVLAATAGLTVALRAAEPASRPTTTQAATTQSAAPSAAPPATKPAPADPRIEAAIRQLSADAWRERQAAQDVLVGFGDDAVPRLREVEKAAEDDEVRTRAAAALAQIERNAQLGGSMVTLHVKEASPKDVFAEIAKQAHCELHPFPRNLWDMNRGRGFGGPGNAKLTLDFDRVPFWTAFREACTKSGVYAQQVGPDGGMGLTQGSSPYWNGPNVINGPFMVVANRIYRSDAIELANPASVQHDFQLSLVAFVEPKIHVVQSSYNVRIDEAVDDKGNSLVFNEPTPEGKSTARQWMRNLNARLKYPAERPGKRIVRLRGGMRFVVQTRSETFEVPDVMKAKNVQKTIAGRRILLKEVKKAGEQYEVQTTVYRAGLSPAEWNAMNYPGAAIRLLDKDGKALSSRGWGGGGGPDEMSYNWTFARDAWGGGEDKAGEPFRLVWEIPTETRPMDVEFKFQDLPMP